MIITRSHAIGRLLLLAFCVAAASIASAQTTAALPTAHAADSAEQALTTSTLEYTLDGVRMVGYLVYDASLPTPRPGVLVVHEWWGLNDYARGRAEDLARAGYVALAADMYGDGVTTTDPKQAGAWAGKVKGSELIRTRSRAALDALAKVPQVDPQRLGALGFCFGGTTALELAWSGAPVDAVASFHGSLTIPKPSDKGIGAGVLVLHGANDQFDSQETLLGFQQAMRGLTLDWQMVYYGNAVHSFTNPNASKAGIPGVAYDERAARRSWQLMLAFFEEKIR